MQALTNAIAHGAGRCDADYLNSTLQREITVYACYDYYSSRKGGGQSMIYSETPPSYYNDTCQQKNIIVIDNTLPSYCVAYQNHGYTYQIGVQYLGDALNGGHWQELN
jgi:hypothetical protein